MSLRYWSSDAAHALCRVTGCPDPVTAMIARADALLDEAAIDGPPVPLAVLASFQGIRRIEPVEMVASGRLIVHPDGSVVQVNRAESPARRQFTIAHEIAHTLLPAYAAHPHDIEDAHTGDYPPAAEEEHLCDVGASALLLPERWLRPAVQQRPPSLATLQDIARQFKASLEATARAVARLDVWPFALVFWEPGWRKADRVAAAQGDPIPPALRVTRAIAAPSFGLYIPRNKSVAEDTSIYQAYASGSPTHGLDRLTLRTVDTNVRAESVYVPLMRGAVLHPRVVSFLLRPDADAIATDRSISA